MERYFLVNYQAVTGEGHTYLGIMSIIMKHGSFLNRKETEELIISNTEDVDLTNTKVILTNITELSEDDYLDWYA